MGLILPTVTTGGVVIIPVGTTTGTILISHSNNTYRGTDRDTCIIVADGTAPYTGLFNYSAPIGTITIENCTLDCNNNSSVLAVIASFLNSADVYMNNVKILGVQRDGIAVSNSGRIYLDNVEFYCDGAAIQSTTSSEVTYLRRIKVYGGRTPFTLSEGVAGSTPGIDIDDFKAYLHYWEAPTYEAASIVSIYETGVDVVSHTIANRSFADCLRLLVPVGTIPSGYDNNGTPWDRLEAEDGTWSYYGRDGIFTGWKASGTWRPTQSPSTVVTVYRPIIGRLGDWDVNSLLLTFGAAWPHPHWRYVDGTWATLQEVQQAVRLDILRHDIADNNVRDVDSGFHITAAADAPVLKNIYIEGGFSDMITVRCDDTVAESCSVYLGQDFGFTIEGSGTWTNCSSEKAGVNGMYIDGEHTIIDMTLLDNGVHDEGGTGMGVGASIVTGATVVLGIKLGRTNRQMTSGNFTQPTPSVSLKPWYRRPLTR